MMKQNLESADRTNRSLRMDSNGIIDVSRSEQTLRIRFAGRYGHGEQNLNSGTIVQNALEEAMNQRGNADVSEVVISLDVSCFGGRRPALVRCASLSPEYRCAPDRIGQVYDWILGLLAVSKMDRLIHLEGNFTPIGHAF